MFRSKASLSLATYIASHNYCKFGMGLSITLDTNIGSNRNRSRPQNGSLQDINEKTKMAATIVLTRKCQLNRLQGPQFVEIQAHIQRQARETCARRVYIGKRCCIVLYDGYEHLFPDYLDRHGIVMYDDKL